jgi:hypothetical protein
MDDFYSADITVNADGSETKRKKKKPRLHTPILATTECPNFGLSSKRVNSSNTGVPFNLPSSQEAFPPLSRGGPDSDLNNFEHFGNSSSNSELDQTCYGLSWYPRYYASGFKE